MMGPFKCTPKESDHKLISDAYKEIENCFDFVCDLCRNKPRICRKCGETEGNISCDWRRSDHLRCEKCQKIQFPIFENADYPFIEEWSYIDYEAIKEKGIEWYIKARDKLIKKIEKYHKDHKIKESLEKQKIKKNINKWIKGGKNGR